MHVKCIYIYTHTCVCKQRDGLMAHSAGEVGKPNQQASGVILFTSNGRRPRSAEVQGQENMAVQVQRECKLSPPLHLSHSGPQRNGWCPPAPVREGLLSSVCRFKRSSLPETPSQTQCRNHTLPALRASFRAVQTTHKFNCRTEQF